MCVRLVPPGGGAAHGWETVRSAAGEPLGAVRTGRLLLGILFEVGVAKTHPRNLARHCASIEGGRIGWHWHLSGGQPRY
jgi:hypothetical protein